MSSPWAHLPTLGQFIVAAKSQGCREGTLAGIVGPRGPVLARYLVGAGRNGAIAILPNIKNREHLTPTMVGNLVRALKIVGFDHCFIDDSKSYGYVQYDPNDPS
jgi:hypothetical protein